MVNPLLTCHTSHAWYEVQYIGLPHLEVSGASLHNTSSSSSSSSYESTLVVALVAINVMSHRCTPRCYMLGLPFQLQFLASVSRLQFAVDTNVPTDSTHTWNLPPTQWDAWSIGKGLIHSVPSQQKVVRSCTALHAFSQDDSKRSGPSWAFLYTEQPANFSVHDWQHWLKFALLLSLVWGSSEDIHGGHPWDTPLGQGDNQCRCVWRSELP